jgi:hypothetical protein
MRGDIPRQPQLGWIERAVLPAVENIRLSPIPDPS